MRLVSLTVQNFRSITNAYRIPLDKAVVLVGPNNEGKSNILRALVVAMNVLTRTRTPGSLGGNRAHRRFFSWSDDYPIGLQEKKPDGQSIIHLEFELEPTEVAEFKKTIGSSLNGTLPIRIALGRRQATVTVAKQGKGAKTLNAKSDAIADFVSRRVDIEHVAAVRTAQEAESVVNSLVARELAALEEQPKYAAALQQIENIQQPLLDLLSDRIRSTLVQFLPAVTAVRIQLRRDDRYNGLRSCDVIVDDGTPTLLRHKGDGAQSLAALGLIRHASESSAKGKHLVVAIEEPESHLHPRAIHDLREVIQELGKKHQVVLTTHCPLFVNRVSVSSNILVQGTKAKAATSIEQIRSSLGVRASDNLRNAELVLVVEGFEDKRSLEALFNAAPGPLQMALAQGTLAIDAVGGAGNIAYKAASLRDSLCRCHLFLDNDAAGERGFEQAREDGSVLDADVSFAMVLGLKESEFEDLLDPDFYAGLVHTNYGASLSSPKFKSNKKWSHRMAEVFKQQGRLWNERVERDLKNEISELVAKSPSSALHPSRRSSFDALTAALESRLNQIAN